MVYLNKLKIIKVSTRATRAAMFGLDARIALAIFGALSVISGAALYSAIQKAKVTSYLTVMNELGKAWEAYYLDTGIEKLKHAGGLSVHNYYINTVELVNSNKAGWKGPYTSLALDGSGHDMKDGLGGVMLLGKFRGDADWSARPEIGANVCDSSHDCYVWVQTYYNEVSYPGDSFLHALDKTVDGGDGFAKGNFRAQLYTNSNGTFKTSYLKYAPISRP